LLRRPRNDEAFYFPIEEGACFGGLAMTVLTALIRLLWIVECW
jgi:hypothetical protein